MAEDAVGAAPRRRSVQCVSPRGLHRMAYLEWGDARNRDVLVCVHGLTRSSRDFDTLAGELASQFRVVCPDVVGRGDSDRLSDAKLYGVAQYLADMVTLIARLDVESVRWVGTSMGGLIGMALAALPASPVAKLVLNDAGPVVSKASLERIGSYLGKTNRFQSLEAAEKHIRMVHAPFGPHTDAQWRHLAETSVRQNDDGSYRPHYDPRIAEAFSGTLPEKDLELWPLYDAIRCPTLVLRGEHSDLLSRDTVQEMRRRGPKAALAQIGGVGHAPTLMQPEQITLVKDFLLQGETS